MQKQTFTDSMTERGYELKYSRNGNITATKGGTFHSPTTSCASARQP